MDLLYNTTLTKKFYGIKLNMKSPENAYVLIESLVSHRLENLKIPEKEEDQKTPIEQCLLTVIAECGGLESASINSVPFTVAELPESPLKEYLKTSTENDAAVPFMFVTAPNEEFTENDVVVIIFGLAGENPDYNFAIATINMKKLCDSLNSDGMDPTQYCARTPIYYSILKNTISCVADKDAISVRVFIEESMNPENVNKTTDKIAEVIPEIVAENEVKTIKNEAPSGFTPVAEEHHIIDENGNDIVVDHKDLT